MARANGFIFDYAKCVGCGACIVACANENGSAQSAVWRNIQTVNPQKLPLLGFVHLSMACNHCIEAPCIRACPSHAYSRRTGSQAVVVDPNVCLGCRFCTWVCPFGAPQYSPDKGVVEKCHFCYHLIENGKIPACAANCPTGALGYGEMDILAQADVPTLQQGNVHPLLTVLNGHLASHSPEMDPSNSGIIGAQPISSKEASYKSWEGLKQEWPLALFTLLGALLAGYSISLSLGGSIVFPFWAFAFVALLALLGSTLHLGRPLRAYLSIRNLKTSWLSREILLFGLFVLVASLSILFGAPWLLYASSALSILFLFSVEKVYWVTGRRDTVPLNSSNTLLTAFAVASLFTEYWNAFIVFLVVKAVLFFINNSPHRVSLSATVVVGALSRLLFGFVLPFTLINFNQTPRMVLIFIPILVAELFDRLLFYRRFGASNFLT